MPQRRPTLALLACLAVLALATAGIAPAADSRQAQVAGGPGYIDWERQIAVGMGAAPTPRSTPNPTQARALAQRAAMLDARRNLLEVVGQVRVDSSSVVQNFMAASDRITTTVQGLLAGATVASERLLPDGTYEVMLTIPLSGTLTQELLAVRPPAAMPAPVAAPAPGPGVAPAPTPAPAAQALPPQAKAPTPAPPAPQNTTAPQEAALPAPTLADTQESAPPAPAPAQPAAPAVAPGLVKAFTGLVVDARGTGFAPSLKPAFMAGKEQLYPGPAVDQAVAVRHGLVRYYRDLAKAQQSREVGHAPKTIKAAAGGPGSVDLSAEDAALLRAVLASPGNFLDNCKVVVVF